MMSNPTLEMFLRAAGTRYARSTCSGLSDRLKHFLRYLEQTKMHYADIKKEDIERYLLTRRSSKAYRNTVWYSLRIFYDYVKLSENPVSAVPIPILPPRASVHVPGQAAIEHAISALTGIHPLALLRNRLSVELAYGSGLRRSELLALDIEDIDPVQSVAYVRGKGGKTRIVPLTGESLQSLRTYLNARDEKNGALLRNVWNGKRITINHVSKCFRMRTGINTHRYRHACATHLLQNGCSLRVVQELLGHAKIDTTLIYTHVDKSKLAQVLAETHPRSEKRRTAVRMLPNY